MPCSPWWFKIELKKSCVNVNLMCGYLQVIIKKQKREINSLVFKYKKNSYQLNRLCCAAVILCAVFILHLLYESISGCLRIYWLWNDAHRKHTDVPSAVNKERACFSIPFSVLERHRRAAVQGVVVAEGDCGGWIMCAPSEGANEEPKDRNSVIFLLRLGVNHSKPSLLVEVTGN